jgi:MYND finger
MSKFHFGITLALEPLASSDLTELQKARVKKVLVERAIPRIFEPDFREKRQTGGFVITLFANALDTIGQDACLGWASNAMPLFAKARADADARQRGQVVPLLLHICHSMDAGTPPIATIVMTLTDDDADISTPVPTCVACRTSTGPLRLCGGCKLARYCSPACSKADWTRHKTECSLIKRADMPDPSRRTDIDFSGDLTAEMTDVH